MVNTREAAQKSGAPSVAPVVPAQRTIKVKRTYRVRLKDLASTAYRSLPMSQWKPPVMSSMTVLWLCELTVMNEVPGVSLGRRFSLDHMRPATWGSKLIVTATCIEPRNRYWIWDVTVRDSKNEDNEKSVIARCTLGFVADVDPDGYHERWIAPKLAARSLSTVCWIRFLNLLSLLGVLVMPLQVAYVWHGLWPRVATETVLALGWLVTKAGLPLIVRDSLTVRRPRKRTRKGL